VHKKIIALARVHANLFDMPHPLHYGSIPIIAHLQEEMSAFQKQLQARHGNNNSSKSPGGPGRVNLKQKKILAMMEEETSLKDSSKNARLVGYKKTEVHNDLGFWHSVISWIEHTKCRDTVTIGKHWI